VKNPHDDFRYTGVCHECIFAPGATPQNRPTLNQVLPGEYVSVLCCNKGARSFDPDKYLHDAEMLKRDLDERGYDPRNQFYYAQTLVDHSLSLKQRCASNKDIEHYQRLGLEAYQKRIDMANREEELKEKPTEYYKSLCSIARIRCNFFYNNHKPEKTQMLFEAAKQAFRDCIQFDDKRPEALLDLAIFLRPYPESKELVYRLSRTAYENRNNPFEKYLFVEQSVKIDCAIFYAKILEERKDHKVYEVMDELKTKTLTENQQKQVDEVAAALYDPSHQMTRHKEHNVFEVPNLP
jgi:hypothetical protein